jgi:hypothetical protein
MFRGYASGIGCSFGVNFGAPIIFNVVITTNAPTLSKSVLKKQVKKGKDVVLKEAKIVANASNNKRERNEIDPDIQEWINSFEKNGSSGSVGLVPISFQKSFLGTARIKYAENDVIKTVHHFLDFYRKKNKV